jgi:hypothetical protein
MAFLISSDQNFFDPNIINSRVRQISDCFYIRNSRSNQIRTDLFKSDDMLFPYSGKYLLILPCDIIHAIGIDALISQNDIVDPIIQSHSVECITTYSQ